MSRLTTRGLRSDVQEALERQVQRTRAAPRAVIGDGEAVADPEREGEHVPDLDLLLVGAEGTEQRAQVIHPPIVDAPEAGRDLPVAPGPVRIARSILSNSSLEKASTDSRRSFASQSSSRAARALDPVKVGELLGWDEPDAGLGSRVPTLRDRLPADLREARSGPNFDSPSPPAPLGR